MLFVGLSMKGKRACHTCGKDLDCDYSKSLHKCVYPSYRRFLPMDHEFRRALVDEFNGKQEIRGPPRTMRPADWEVAWREALERRKMHKAATRGEKGKLEADGLKASASNISIFYNLPYWSKLKIVHLLNPMHIFKNVAESLWKHLTGDKDTKAMRADLQASQTKSHLWQKDDGSYEEAPWALKKNELETVLARIKTFRTPTGLGGSWRLLFVSNDDKLCSLKTHDWYNFLKHVLPLVIQGCLTPTI